MFSPMVAPIVNGLRQASSTRTSRRQAEQIAAALYLPGRQQRLDRWPAEFLAEIGDHPDPDERADAMGGLPTQRVPARSGGSQQLVR